MTFFGIDLGQRRNLLRSAMVAALVSVLAVSILFLSFEVLRKLRSLDIAQSDNVQWSLSQLEVELLLMHLALRDAESGDAASMDKVRRRFDIFYSRLSTIDQGVPYQRLKESDEFTQSLEQIRDFLSDSVGLIDGSDAVLGAEISGLENAVLDLRENVRSLSLQGLEQFARISDERRNDISATLRWLAWTTAGLVLALIVLSAILARMNRTAAQRAKTEHQLAARMQAIIGSSLDAVVFADERGIVQVFNGAAERVFGYTETEAVGRSLAELIIPEKYVAAHAAGLKRFVETREKRVVGAGRVELEGKRKSGEVFPVEFSIDMAESAEETIFVSYLRDITDRKLAEEELVETRDRALAGEKAKAEFLAMMSHEMRTPLNGLLGTLSLLRETELSDRQSTFLDNMDVSGQLLLHHVNDVLDISKFEAGRIQINAVPFNLDEMLADIVAAQGSVAASHGNNLEFEWVSEKPGEVRGDPVRLRQIVLNLVNNAIKFTQSGDVRVEAERLGNGFRSMFEFRIIDNGIGIAEADLGRIFNDFETLDRSYGRMVGGTGLGLGIARRLVEAMGGEIGAESEEGEGSLFWVRVPLEVVGTNRSRPTEPAREKPCRALDILIVEDNEINRQVLEAMLHTDGHSVSQAVNGQEGVACAESRAFDIILMDVSMPVMDGVTATRAIRSGDGPCRDVPILAVTAHAMPEDKEKFRAAGMSGLVTKPIARDDLRRNLERFGNPAGKRPDTGRGEAEDDPDGGFSPESLTELVQAIGAERARKLLAEFMREMDEGVAFLAAGERDGVDLPTLIASVHKMAGSCGTFGATRLRLALSDIETLAKSGNEAEARSSIAAIEAMWRSDRRYFERQDFADRSPA